MQSNRSHRLQWLPWTVAIVSAVCAVASWGVLNLQEHARFEKESAAAAQLAEVLISRDLASRMAALQRLVHHWQLAQGAAPGGWEGDVAKYMADEPSYQVIEWVDPSMQIRRALSSPGILPAKDFDVAGSPDALRAARMAEKTGQTVLAPLILPQQDDGLLAACLPLYLQDRYAGLMVAVFRIIPWLDAVLMRDHESNYQVSVSIDNQPVYGSVAQRAPVDESWSKETALSMYGLDWTIKAFPTAQYVRAIHSWLSTVVLVFGLILSALLGWIVHGALIARQQAQQLRHSSAQLTTLLKNLPGVAYRFMNEGKWPAEFISDRCWELCGFSKSEFEEQRIFWTDLVHPDDQSSMMNSVREAARNGRPYENEYRIITRDSQEKWVWCRGRMIHAEDGEKTYLEGLITDITSRKHDATALVDAEAYAKAIVDTAAEAVITVDASGRIETFNRAAQQMFGYTFAEIAGKNVRTLVPLPYAAEHDQYISHFLETRQPHMLGSGLDVTGQKKDGSLFPIRLSVSEVPHHGERKLVGLIRDLSEQRAAEQEAREHRERLAHVDRLNMLGQMATGIAHEINQPLSAISMYAQSGIRFLDSPVPRLDRLRDALEKLGLQAHRAGAIIERMQQLGKQHESRREDIDGNELLKQVHNLAETDARMRDMVIDLELCAEPSQIVGDPVQLQQVALNLLRNGMEAMESRGVRGDNRIVLRTQRSDDGFMVSVVDRGVGVSDEVAAQLYSPFSTTKETGMGLGLSICMSIISAHGGQLGFVNNPEGGATFYFTLPNPKQENS